MPGLLRGVARTAVIAGTATAVSNRVSRRQATRWSQQGTNPYDQPAYAEPAPRGGAAATAAAAARPDRAADEARRPQGPGHPHGGGVRDAEGTPARLTNSSSGHDASASSGATMSLAGVSRPATGGTGFSEPAPASSRRRSCGSTRASSDPAPWL